MEELQDLLSTIPSPKVLVDEDEFKTPINDPDIICVTTAELLKAPKYKRPQTPVSSPFAPIPPPFDIETVSNFDILDETTDDEEDFTPPFAI